MNLLWLACVAIVGLATGFLVGGWRGVGLMRPTVQQLSRNLANDHNFALCVLRRELANWMLRHDPDRYLRIYKEAHEASTVISAADRNDQQAELAKLSEQYPFYMNFDLLGTREHVLYVDTLSRRNSYDEVERHYRDIVRFQALQVAFDENWWGIQATSDDDLGHLEKYVQKFKNTRFKNRLQDAIDQFNDYESNVGDSSHRDAQKPLYETAAFSVRRVPHFAETRYGVHFKDTEEFGLYTVFYGDRDEPYIGFYRSDAGFIKEIMLDYIRLDEPV